jgi:histidyl-tRNA synthetase
VAYHPEVPSNVTPPRGMRDFLPDEKALRDGVMARIRDTYSSYGYREIETPVAEELSRLESGQGGDNEKLIFKILRRGLDPVTPLAPAEAADLGLRFDLTLPLTRFYATHRGELPAVFRSIQIAPVWRAERPQKGRYRQFTQCDIDVLGESSNVAEVELITATLAALGGIGIEGTSVRLNDRRVLHGILDACGYPGPGQPQALISVDKLDKIGVAGVADELRHDDPGAAADRLIDLLEVLAPRVSSGEAADFDTTLDALPAGVAGPAADLVAIRDAVRRADPEAAIVADPTLVRGMGYYTGTIFELTHPASSSSVGGGGRYDGMIGRFAGTDVPGCGFSIGFERIVDLVDPARFRPARRLVALVFDDGVDPGHLVATQRRLIDGGAGVRLVRRTRNLGHLLGSLEAEGFDAWAALDPGGADDRWPELQPLGADSGSGSGSVAGSGSGAEA